MPITAGKVVILNSGVKRMAREDVAPWLQKVLNTAQTEARNLVNVDTGDLKASITTAIEHEPDIVGFVLANKNYAIWQELEPGDRTAYLPVTTGPGAPTRKRKGGKAFLRPGVLKAIRQHTD